MSVQVVSLPTLRKGSQGEPVYIAQLLLNNFHGFDIKTDAIFSADTEKAIKDLQTRRKFSATGVVDKLTWEALATPD